MRLKRRKILLTAIIFLVFSIFAKTTQLFLRQSPVLAVEGYPRAYLWQERDGMRCSYPDCLTNEHNIFFRFELKMVEPGECVRPWNPSKTISPEDFLYIYVQVDGLYEWRHLDSSSRLNDQCQSGVIDIGRLDPLPHTIKVTAAFHPPTAIVIGRAVIIGPRTLISEKSFIINSNCPPADSYCGNLETSIVETHWQLCSQVGADDESLKKCLDCVDQDGVWTAVGCIPTDPVGLIQTLIKIGLLIGGGIALLIILAGAFTLTVSQGDPKKTSEAKEMITSAIIGLIFIIFSVAILQFIGVQILRIPEFGG
jgi:hypothetical protein